MIANLIAKYIELKFEQVNLLFDNTLIIRRSRNFELEKLSAGESNITYQLSILSGSNLQLETNRLKMYDCEILFKFLVKNKDSDKYREIINRYLITLERLLRYSETPKLPYTDYDISQGLIINSIKDVSINNLDKVDAEYFYPSIKFSLRIYDNQTNFKSIATAV